jgi:hypothetical protein
LFNYSHDAEWTPFKVDYISANLVALRIQNGAFGTIAENSNPLKAQEKFGELINLGSKEVFATLP